MKKTIRAIFIGLFMIALTGIFVMSDSIALAADQERTQEQLQTQEQL